MESRRREHGRSDEVGQKVHVVLIVALIRRGGEGGVSIWLLFPPLRPPFMRDKRL